MCTHEISEWREVHTDGEHTAGQAKLRELSFSRRNNYSKIHPAYTQHTHHRQCLREHSPLKHTQIKQSDLTIYFANLDYFLITHKTYYFRIFYLLHTVGLNVWARIKKKKNLGSNLTNMDLNFKAFNSIFHSTQVFIHFSINILKCKLLAF